MEKYRTLLILSTLILLACALGAQGQYQMPLGGYPTAAVGSAAAQSTASQVSQYSQYYTMPTGPAQTAQAAHITAPTQFDIAGSAPSTLYVGKQQQPVPFAQYQSFAGFTGGSSLWIQGTTSWTQSAVVPQGALLSLIATTPTGGNGYLYEIYPDGRLVKNYYYFFPYNRINFIADQIGQHILLFVEDGHVSNTVIIEVVAYNPPGYPGYPGYIPPAYISPGYLDYYLFGPYWPLFPICSDGRSLCRGKCCPRGQVCVNGDCKTPSCPEGRQRCDGECCPRGQVCINGDCKTPSCPDGKPRCDGKCCPEGQVCINDDCRTPPCPDGKPKCNGECCPEGQVCINGDCKTPSCPDGKPKCNGECCQEGQVCINGDCRTPACPDGKPRCDGKCCPPGEVCINGDCKKPPKDLVENNGTEDHNDSNGRPF